jgi:copper transport protein
MPRRGLAPAWPSAMKKIFKWSYSIGLLILLAPFVASAHALPVSSSPESSAVLTQAPSQVTITFSENVDQAASSIVVTGPTGAIVSEGDAKTAAGNAHVFSVQIKSDGNGTYVVSWSSVSADDGHFTKGAYPFAVGKGQMAQMSSMSDDVEIVELSTTPEALGSAVELLGHGFLWAVLLLFAFAVRPLLLGGKFDEDAPIVRRVLAWLVYIGALFAFFGGVAQLAVKTQQLSVLRSTDLLNAFHIYIGTDAGIATLVRMAAVVLFVLIFLFGHKAIQTAKRITPCEIALFATLCCFAYFRAKISHAASNPFHPGFSIFINFFHLIEKDVWAGIVGILATLALLPRARQFLIALLPRAFQMLAVDFALVSVTATYIVWLHLKTFANLFTTDWGSAFLELLLVAVFLVGMRLYHVLARLYRPRMFARLLPVSLAAEFAFAVLVVYCSSVVIITSPPLSQPVTKIFSAYDQGIAITLERDNAEDGMLLLSDSGGKGAGVPVITVQGGSASPLSINLSQRFLGGYVFPEALLPTQGSYQVAITVPQSGAYDAHANFAIQAGDFDPKPGWEAQRPLDSFSIIMMVIALAAFAFAIPLYLLSGKETPSEPPARRRVPEVLAIGAFVLVAFLGADTIAAFHGSWLENPYAAECNGDGNMWHTMLPSMAGQPTSQTPAEGCMWGMGNYMYMFPDQREYDYYKNLGAATVTLDTAPQGLIAGVPTTLTVSLKNPDGSPATLFVDMDKLIHVIIISKDESVFAHIHPDDTRPLTQQEINSSTFTVNYTFPKAGDYLVAFDYAHGVVLESKQFQVHVAGSPQQSDTVKEYPTEGMFDGYNVSLKYSLPIAGQVETIFYTVTKNGQPVEFVPYLDAAMHVAVVKNDFSWYLHVHGEVHPPGVPLPPIIIKNGQVVHSMAMMTVPDHFTLPIEAHLIFPTPGLYTVWGQFKTTSGDLVASAFTIRVEQ